VPSFIRIEADELTYPLHIMVRYELEKALIEGSLEVEDLPLAWNEKMTTYLGVTPPTDTLGVLQDVHWSDGLFGYFPSYALGTAYAAQIQHALSKDIDIETALESGDFSQIKTWLGEKIHAHGLRKTAPELIELATGQPFKAEYYTRYLKDKYSALYNL
jgi:carboxypeptidase Taq